LTPLKREMPHTSSEAPITFWSRKRKESFGGERKRLGRLKGGMQLFRMKKPTTKKGLGQPTAPSHRVGSCGWKWGLDKGEGRTYPRKVERTEKRRLWFPRKRHETSRVSIHHRSGRAEKKKRIKKDGGAWKI